MILENVSPAPTRHVLVVHPDEYLGQILIKGLTTTMGAAMFRSSIQRSNELWAAVNMALHCGQDGGHVDFVVVGGDFANQVAKELKNRRFKGKLILISSFAGSSVPPFDGVWSFDAFERNPRGFESTIRELAASAR